MPRSVVLLVIASALAHATWNAILKRCRDPENAVIGMMFVGGTCSVLYATLVQIPLPARASLAWSFAAGVLEAGYFITLARALSRTALGTVYTVVRGGALVVVWPISVLLLGEHISLVRALGTAIVVLGLAATGVGDRSAKSAPSTSSLRSGVGVAAICALFVAGYHLAYKMALAAGGRPEAVVAISLSTASIIDVTVIGPRRRLAFAAVRAQPLKIMLGGVLASAGFLVFLAAMKDAGAGVVLTLRNTSILFAQVLSFGLGERPRRLGVVGAALVSLGAVLLAR